MIEAVDTASSYSNHDPRADPVLLVASFHDLDHYFQLLLAADAVLAKQVNK
jgi:hypothetical protein